MAFYPDKYLADKGASPSKGFDPDAYLASKTEQPGKLHDALIGAAQGASLGFGDEIKGVGDTAIDALKGDVDPTSLDDILSTYRQHQKENEKGVDEAKARSPKTVLAAELVGGLLPGILSGGASEAATGANAAKTLGQLALRSAGKGAVLGGLAGVGGSHGTIENPEEVAKDAAFGAGGGAILGGAAPYAGKALSAAKDALAPAGAALSEAGFALASVPGKMIPQGVKDMASDSPFLEKLAYAYGKARDGSQAFAGKDAGPDIERQLQQTSGSIANQFLNPLTDTSKLYGQVLQEAGDNGARLSTDNGELMNALAAAKARLSGASTGDSKKALDLLNQHGAQTMDRDTLQQLSSKLTPQQAKTLQNTLRGLGNSQSFNDTPALSDAAKALGPAIDSSLPEGQMADINSKFSDARKLVEPLINKGEIDPDFQSKSVSDIDTDQLGAKLKSYLQNNLLPNTEASNTKGDKAKLALSDILDNAKSLNEKAQTQFLDPDSIATQAKDIGMKTAIRKSMVGETGGSDGIPVSTNPMGWIKGTPLRGAELTGKAIRNVANVGSAIVVGGRNLYQSTNEGLSRVAETLTGAGYVGIANSLSKALSSQDNGAKNAALFTIMQNPDYYKAVFGNDKDSEGTK